MKDHKWYDVKEAKSVKEIMEYTVSLGPTDLAYRYKKDKGVVDVTFQDFQNDTLYLAKALSKLNLEGKHIAVIGDNSYDWLTVFFTVLKSKSVLVPVDKELPIKDIINVLTHSESEILFYASRYEKNIDEISKAVPNIKYFIGFNNTKESDKKLSYKKFMESGKKAYNKEGYTEPDIDTNATKMIIYTSGTTGLAKGVMLSEHNIVSVAVEALRLTRIQKSGLSVLPYHHTYEAIAGILTSLLNHTTVCINDSLKSILPNLELFKPEHIYIVPAFAELFYKKIWATAEKEGKAKLLKTMIKVSDALRKVGIDLRRPLFSSVLKAFGGNLKEIVCGGAPLRPEVGNFFNSIGVMFLNGYGITECSPLVCVNTPYLNDPTTVGLPLRCVEVKLEDVTDEGIGEICVKGDIVMLGYYKDEEKTKEVLKDGWFRTGDFGMITDKGQIVITGRKKNIIVLENGKNVYPEEIENYILSIPYIQEVVVKPTINEHGFNGNNLCAEVFLNQEKVAELGDIDIKEKLKDDINNVTADLPVYKHVSDIEIREKEFEKTTTNKIKR